MCSSDLFSLQYEHGSVVGDWFGRLDWSWTDDYNTSLSLDPRLVQPAYSWINLRTGIKRERIEWSVWIENLLNRTAVDHTSPLNVYSGDGSYHSFLQQGRTLGVTVRIAN